MADNQQLVDEIRSLLQSSDLTMTDRFKELADAYAEACRTANQRLRRCDDFLKKGLRSEAIQFAQAEPALLDVVGTLDFPERTTFQEWLTFYMLPEPPPLLLEIAQALNEAYAEEQPLEESMRQHRRLALLRAPLTERLKVMRQIAKIDKNNLIWGDDIQTFETARFREIQAETSGRAKGDAARMAVLAEELEQTNWLAPLPTALLEQIQKECNRLVRQQSRAELEDIVRDLTAAMNSGNVQRAQDLRKSYLTQLMRMKLAENDPLLRQVERPLNWLAQFEEMQAGELEFQNAVAALQDALDAEEDPEELEQLYHAALDLGRDLPRRLEKRYRQYIARQNRSRRWRERIILLAVVFGGLILVLGIIGFLWLSSRSHSS